MTPYSTLETLLAYAAVVLALLVLSLFLGALGAFVTVWLARANALPPHTTPVQRRERLLKLISSTDREDYR